MSTPYRVVIVGGGFGGLNAARWLRRSPVQVTLIDRRNFHLFQPLLYQVATGALSPANIAAPLRGVLRRQRNAEVVLGEVKEFDVQRNRVVLTDREIAYDFLIVAAGAKYNYFGHDEWESLAPGLKTLEDATSIRARILQAFEAAEWESDDEKRRALLTFVIVGGGATGVEMAGALAEIARLTFRHDFRHINPAEAKILLVEGVGRILSGYHPTLSRRAQKTLEQLGVTVRTNAIVTDVRSDSVRISSGSNVEVIPARTVLWTAGVRASPLAQRLAIAAGAQTDRAGRILVEPDLSLPKSPNVFVIGDMAHYHHQTGKPLPGVAPVAIQQGRYVAKLIQKRLKKVPVPPFQYRDHGSMATIGRSAAVAQFGRLKLSGFFAWWIWLFIHLLQIVQFQNRLLIVIQWGWNYLTLNRSARLITDVSVEKPAKPQSPEGQIPPR